MTPKRPAANISAYAFSAGYSKTKNAVYSGLRGGIYGVFYLTFQNSGGFIRGGTIFGLLPLKVHGIGLPFTGGIVRAKREVPPVLL